MYLYLNLFLAPASHVLSYPSANATQIQIRLDIFLLRIAISKTSFLLEMTHKIHSISIESMLLVQEID